MDQWLDRFISATAWAMEKPPAYGAFHILFTLIGFAVCIFAAWKLRHISDKGFKILLLCIGIFLLVCEVYKQLFYYFWIEDNSYAWWIFPFQLCSIPMYLCIIAPLLKKGRVQSAMLSFMMLYNLLGGAISFGEPSGLMHEYWTLTLHALTWHMLLVFVGLYLAFSGRGGYEKKDYLGATVTYLILCVIAFSINLLLRNISAGTVNMFYIGPSNSPIAVFKQISEMFGWYINTLVYIPVMCLGSFLVYLPIHKVSGKKMPAKVV